MKLSLLIASAALVLVPTAAFADDAQPEPPVVKPVANGNDYVAPHAVEYEGGKIPADASLERRPNMTLIGTGLVILGVAYVPSVITAIAVCGPQTDCTSTKGAGWLYWPVVGPFITAAMATSPGGAALAAFDGGLQVTGAALAISGFIARKKFVVWQDKTASLQITPGAPSTSAGLSLTLTHL